MRKILAVVTLAFIFAGCAETYVGPGPNLKLSSESDRKQEFLKFRFTERNPWIQGWSTSMNGHEYFLGSVRSFSKDISPSSEEKFETAHYLQNTGLVFAITAIGLCVASGVTHGSTSTGLLLGGLGALVGEVTLFTVGSFKIATGIRYYNEDLAQKLHVSAAQ